MGLRMLLLLHTLIPCLAAYTTSPCLAAYYTALVSPLFVTVIPTSFNTLMEMFLLLCYVEVIQVFKVDQIRRTALFLSVLSWIMM